MKPAHHTIRLGISTCPNDTFAFHAILTGKVAVPGLQFDIELLDVQELNERLFEDRFDVAKASFHAALLLSQRYGVLQSGSALGFGVGPLLLAAETETSPAIMASNDFVTLCPGQHTTATLLYRLFYPERGRLKQVVFNEIMPALQAGAASFGVCIHEGRFTYQQVGLACVEDLGTRWERETGQPLPLGGILCRLDLPIEVIGQVQDAIHGSILYGLSHRQETLESMRKYAQEFSDDVLFSHVDLYVNEWTQQLGTVGRGALKKLHEKAVEAGAITREQPPIAILPDDLGTGQG